MSVLQGRLQLCDFGFLRREQPGLHGSCVRPVLKLRQPFNSELLLSRFRLAGLLQQRLLLSELLARLLALLPQPVQPAPCSRQPAWPARREPG
jgi:hypothetical protein